MEHNAAIRTYMAIMAERDVAVRERNMALDERRRAFAERDMAIMQRDAAITERNTAIEDRDKALHALQVGENIYDDEMPHNYSMTQMSEHGYDSSQIPTNSHNAHVACEDVKTKKTDLTKEAKEGASTTKKMAESSRMGKQGSEGTGRQVNVGSSKVWGDDALDVMM